MSCLIDTIEARTPGWHWLCYRTWRARGEYSLTAHPSMEMATYRATRHATRKGPRS